MTLYSRSCQVELLPLAPQLPDFAVVLYGVDARSAVASGLIDNLARRYPDYEIGELENMEPQWLSRHYNAGNASR